MSIFLLDGYDPSGFYCELLRSADNALLRDRLAAIPTADFKRRVLGAEQALYNLLKTYFDGTPAAWSFGGSTGTAPLNYLQLYWNDIQYANNHANSPATIVEAGGSAATMSFQDLLNQASQNLLAETPGLPVG